MKPFSLHINLVLGKFSEKTVRYKYFPFPYEIWTESKNALFFVSMSTEVHVLRKVTRIVFRNNRK